MAVPYQEIGSRQVRGWSVMDCRNPEPHAPHSWDAQYIVHGPYACPGVESEEVTDAV